MRQKMLEKFSQLFGDFGEAYVYFAPGRVNLIGEHTDYNGGHVFPCALTIGTYLVVRKNEEKRLRLYSMNFEDIGVLETSMENIVYKKEDNWTNYPKGVIWALKEKGYKIDKGLDFLFYGNLPAGSGLSSSASIEVLTGYAISELFDLGISPVDLALITQYAENRFNGVNCGIMDQFAITMGRKNQAIFLDTADLSYEYAPIELKNAKIVIMNSNKKRGLGDSKYNIRRKECETALFDLRQVIDIKSLGELKEEEFELHKGAIKDPDCLKRARHAVYENRRTIKAVEALKKNNISLFGKLMQDSHVSLKVDYEVTGVELDTLVEEALKQPGVIGARMTGAGFGGCAISIVESDKIDDFIQNVGVGYQERIGYKADFYVVEIGDGPARI